jgi:hypothetical protein
MFDGFWFHLLGYPSVRSLTVALEPPGDLDRIARGGVFYFIGVNLPEGACERT